MLNNIISYKELCILENVKSLQKGMNYRINDRYSVILMSQKNSCNYTDKLSESTIIEYEGHNIPGHTKGKNPVKEDQPFYTKNKKLTENGKFALAAYYYKNGLRDPEYVKVYEKIFHGVWIDHGLYLLVDYEYTAKKNRKVFVFYLKPYQLIEKNSILIKPSRHIPSDIKKRVWKRDKGKCIICGSKINLHFDHDLPYSKGGTSISEKNVRILCAKCNYKKSNKIE